MKPASVELRIGELVLRGFEPGNGHRISEAVEHELARVFAEDGVPLGLAREAGIARVDGGTFEARPGMGAEVVGVQVARAVYEGLSA